jgi:two-component system response regulator FixJ
MSDLVVYIVDDDSAVRDSLSLLLSLRGYSTASFSRAEDFLATVGPNASGCLIADIRMPGMSGLELLDELVGRGASMPAIVITAHGSAGAARRAFKARALDFLEKPFEENDAIEAVESAFARERARLAARGVAERKSHGLQDLTPRERQVVELLVQGLHHSDIGDRLGISSRTVEVHKSRIMAKLGARSVAELVRIALPSLDPD